MDPLPLRTCTRCTHWNRDSLKLSDVTKTNSPLDGICEQDDDGRKHDWRRSSDRCSHWSRRE